MYELQYASKETASRLRELTGGFNEFPPQWREISEKEFVNRGFFHYMAQIIEYRQMLAKEKKEKLLCATLFHMPVPGEGFALAHQAGELRFFAFGCDHQWKELTPLEAREEGVTHFGTFDHVYKCSKCGRTKAEDSSG